MSRVGRLMGSLSGHPLTPLVGRLAGLLADGVGFPVTRFYVI